MEFSPEIRAYYEHAPEHERLRTGPFQLEFERTKELLRERLPEPPAIILDVGGGPGAYALWLAELGYEVHLIDPVASLVAHAQACSQMAARGIKSCSIGDARALEWKSNSVDAVLELGPLYHLVQRADRLEALSPYAAPHGGARASLRRGHILVRIGTRWAQQRLICRRDLSSHRET